MIKFRHTLFFASLSLTSLVLATPNFGYDGDSARTLLQDLSGVGAPSLQGWRGTLTTDIGDDPLYLNAIEVTPGAGFDSNISYSTASSFTYSDSNSGTSGTYILGEAIPDDVNWSFGDFVSFDTFNSTEAAVGTYNFTVNFLGGSDASATDTLQSFDLQIDVINSFGVSVTGTADAITGPGDRSDVMLTLQNDGPRGIVINSWYYINYGFQINPSDPANSPHLTGDFIGNWFNDTIAPGSSRTDGHTSWGLDGTSTVGTYTGTIGLTGGAYRGDLYNFVPNPAVTIDVQAVPEPATMAVLGLGAASLIRRRKKA